MQQHWTKVARLPRGPLVCSCTQASKLSAISTTLPKSPTFQGGPLALSFALASKLLSAILTNLSFFPDSPNSPALQGGPLLFSFPLGCKLLSAILTNLPFLPDSPALQGGPHVFSFALASKLLLAKFCHFCHFCCCVHFWTYLPRWNCLVKSGKRDILKGDVFCHTSRSIKQRKSRNHDRRSSFYGWSSLSTWCLRREWE